MGEKNTQPNEKTYLVCCHHTRNILKGVIKENCLPNFLHIS